MRRDVRNVTESARDITNVVDETAWNRRSSTGIWNPANKITPDEISLSRDKIGLGGGAAGMRKVRALTLVTRRKGARAHNVNATPRPLT